MEAATTRATTVEATATVATTAVEAAATTAVGTSPTTTVTTAMLGESRDRQANEYERGYTREKRLEQGGFPHMKYPPPKRRLEAQEGKPPLLILPLFGTLFQTGSCPQSAKTGLQAEGVERL
jgi:hypothetical protein